MRWSPSDVSVGPHFVILWMTDIWAKFDALVSARARDASVVDLQIILRHPSEFVPPTICHINLYEILEDFDNHLVSYDYCRVLAPIHWAYTKGYLTWLYRVSHPIMTPNTHGRPPRPSNKEVLKAKDDHTQDISNIFRHNMDMARSDIETGLLRKEGRSWPLYKA